MAEGGREELDLSWLREKLRPWSLKDPEGKPVHDEDKHFLAFIAILGPGGRVTTAFPAWDDDAAIDKESIKQDLHKWLDSAFDLWHNPSPDEEL